MCLDLTSWNSAGHPHLARTKGNGIRHRNLKCQMIQPTCGTDGQSTCCRASRCNVAFWHFRSTQAHQAGSNCLWPWRCSSRATIRQSGTSFTKPRNTASPASSSFPSNAEATDGPRRVFPPQMSRVSLYMPTGEWASMRSSAVYGLCIRFHDSCAESKELIQRVLELTRLEPLLLARKISSVRVLVSSKSHFLLLIAMLLLLLLCRLSLLCSLPLIHSIALFINSKPVIYCLSLTLTHSPNVCQWFLIQLI